MSLTYAKAGVDNRRADRTKEGILRRLKATFRPGVIDLPWGFGGLYRLKPEFGNLKDPVLVAGTDGVGTKLKIAFATGRHDTVGIDLVAMSANDILCQGAEPFLFLDYIACPSVASTPVAEIVKGVVEGCRLAHCSLVGGETAQMPGFYRRGEYDLAGMALGIAERRRLLPCRDVRRGDVIIGLPSSGLHANGYTLARRALRGIPLSRRIPELGRTLGEELLKPTRIYAREVLALLRHPKLGSAVKGLANITGGGLDGNLPRMLPKGMRVRLDFQAWERPAIFDLIQREGGIDEREMRRTFNCGVGMAGVVAPRYADAVCRRLDGRVIGEVVSTGS